MGSTQDVTWSECSAGPATLAVESDSQLASSVLLSLSSANESGIQLIDDPNSEFVVERCSSF